MGPRRSISSDFAALLLVLILLSPPVSTVSETGGEIWSEEHRLNVISGSIENSDPMDPSIIKDSNGHFHVCVANWNDSPRGINYYHFDENMELVIERFYEDDWTNYHPQLVIDSEFNIHIIYDNPAYPPENEFRYHKLSYEGHKLIEDKLLFTTYFNPLGFDIAIDDDDDIHVVWSEFLNAPYNDNEVFYGKIDNTGEILVDRTQVSERTPWEDWWPVLQLDPWGNCHVIWWVENEYEGNDNSIHYAKLDNDGNIVVEDKNLTSNDVDGYCVTKHFDIDDEGYIHFACSGSLPGHLSQITYMKLDNDGNELLRRRLDGGGGSWEVESPYLMVNDQRLYFAWLDGAHSEQPEVYFKVANLDGDFLSEDIKVTNATEGDNTILSESPMLIGSNGLIHVFWRDNREYKETDTNGYHPYYKYNITDLADIEHPPVRLGAPVLEELPSPDSDGSYTLRWSAVENATAYMVMQSNNSQFEEATSITTEESHLEVVGMENGTYYYRVMAQRDHIQSNWSNVVSVEVRLAGGTQLDAPAFLEMELESTTGEYLVRWQHDDDAVEFQLQESAEPTFSSPTLVYTGPERQWPISSKADGTYYYRVMAESTEAFSDWSGTAVVTVVLEAPGGDGGEETPEDEDDGTPADGGELDGKGDEDNGTWTLDGPCAIPLLLILVVVVVAMVARGRKRGPAAAPPVLVAEPEVVVLEPARRQQ